MADFFTYNLTNCLGTLKFLCQNFQLHFQLSPLVHCLIFHAFRIISENEDFKSVEKLIEFAPDQAEVPVTIHILDDDEKPILEGIETLYVSLQFPSKATITEPETTKILINDKELDGMSQIPVFNNSSNRARNHFRTGSQAASR